MPDTPSYTDKNNPADNPKAAPEPHDKPQEIGGPKGLEPTRYGDWERSGKCVDF